MDIRNFFRKFPDDDKAGIYITVIFHLTVIIVLLIIQLSSFAVREDSFLIDFTKQEEKEKLQEETEFKEEISRKLDDLLANVNIPVQNTENIRNLAVDASSDVLKDDRGTDARELYDDAARLAKELSGNKTAIEEDARGETVDLGRFEGKEDRKKEKEYKGPSVVSYSLDGRKASHLSIPAYRCMGGGEVTVIITVNPHGNVIDAKIYDDVSSSDECLRDFAIRAARLSRFSSLPPAKINGLSRQKGEIVYRFIAQ